ncbi:putative ATP-grasp target RiPP [Nonomuraea maritima]|uniref:Putative ATP-grasp target RiPP n=1 Tax=Nonomuraea maritima TaxID=683260 RepID=A0A1G9ME79_9ACTN|nr:putative ATP-grasp-modified RiPP [Nonomuraea maritima]SDL72588.1 putative ATP-grasp target RiPP [Nonomuraea maritima]
MTITATRPWGMSRMTPHMEAVPLPWASTVLDEDTQLAIYRDGDGRPVPITAATYQTVTTSRPHDGSGNASPSADDSNTDQK